MPDLDDFLAPLLRDAQRMDWDVPEHVRTRGARRRTRRHAAAAVVAVLVVLGVVAGTAWAFDRPSAAPDPGVVPGRSRSATPSPAPSPSGPAPSASAPSPTTSVQPSATSTRSPVARIPDAALLRAEDVGSGFTADESSSGDDHGSIRMMMAYCGQRYTQADAHESAWRKHGLSVPTTGETTPTRYVVEDVVRYERTWAARHMADLRAALPRCRTIDIMANPEARVTWTVIATDFVGDGSILIKETGYGRVQYHGMAYRGDLEVRLRIHIGATDAEARAIVQRATDRLCAALAGC